jgi:hypothetical protein
MKASTKFESAFLDAFKAQAAGTVSSDKKALTTNYHASHDAT